MENKLTVNTTALREWLKSETEINGESPEVRLMKGARISSSTLRHILNGRVPGRQTRYLISDVLNMDESYLFSPCPEDGEIAA